MSWLWTPHVGRRLEPLEVDQLPELEHLQVLALVLLVEDLGLLALLLPRQPALLLVKVLALLPQRAVLLIGLARAFERDVAGGDGRRQRDARTLLGALRRRRRAALDGRADVRPLLSRAL